MNAPKLRNRKWKVTRIHTGHRGLAFKGNIVRGMLFLVHIQGVAIIFSTNSYRLSGHACIVKVLALKGHTTPVEISDQQIKCSPRPQK